ncbi:MAG: archease [Acidimicrobiales bacterium]
MSERSAREARSRSPGHRLVDHVADCVIEARGPDPQTCISEALIALVESVVRIREPQKTATRQLPSVPCPVEDALVALLDEVIFSLEVRSEVPVRFRLLETENGGFAGDMDVVPVASAELLGPVPKAASYHDLEVSNGARGWRCHVLVDL